MALEVNELGIRMRVQEEAEAKNDGVKSACGHGGEGGGERPSNELVEACVRRVLQVLKTGRER